MVKKNNFGDAVAKFIIYSVITAGIVVTIFCVSYGGWRLKRWINWKFSYGNKVELRINQLEQRVEALEKR